MTLYNAITTFNEDEARRLIEEESYLKEEFPEEYLILSIFSEQFEIAKLLIEKRVGIDFDFRGKTPLELVNDSLSLLHEESEIDYPIYKQYSEIQELLIQAGAK